MTYWSCAFEVWIYEECWCVSLFLWWRCSACVQAHCRYWVLQILRGGCALQLYLCASRLYRVLESMNMLGAGCVKLTPGSDAGLTRCRCIWKWRNAVHILRSSMYILASFEGFSQSFSTVLLLAFILLVLYRTDEYWWFRDGALHVGKCFAVGGLCCSCPT